MLTPTYIVPRERIHIPMTGPMRIIKPVRSVFVYALLLAVILLFCTFNTSSQRNTVSPSVNFQQKVEVKAAIAPEVVAVSSKLVSLYKLDTQQAQELAELFVKYGKAENHDPLLLAAISQHESGFDQSAKSAVGAVGVMQILPRWHMDKIPACGDFRKSAEANVCTGSKVLRATKNMAASLTMALQLYNGNPSDKTTRYTNAVMYQYRKLKKSIG